MSIKSQFSVQVVNETNTNNTGVTFPAGASASNVLECGGTCPTGIFIPDNFTDCSLTFRVSKLPPDSSNIGAIQTVQLDHPGTGYSSNPDVSFSGGGGSGAQAHCEVLFAIDTVTVNDGGSFNSMPAVSVVGSGIGATFTCTMEVLNAAPNGMTTYGTGYEVGDTIVFAGGTHTTAATVIVTSICLSGAEINNAGTGYAISDLITLQPNAFASNPVVILVGAVDAFGAVTNIFISNPGQFTGTPTSFTQSSTTGSGTGFTIDTLEFGCFTTGIPVNGDYSVLPASPVAQASTSGSGTGATFTPYWDILAIAVTSGGADYSSSSEMVFTGGGKHVEPDTTINLESTGGVGYVILDEPGTDYLSEPSIVFTGGGGSGAAASATILGTGFSPLQNFDATSFTLSISGGKQYIPLQPALFNSVLFLELISSVPQDSESIVDFSLAPLFSS